jgi:hypothetical protein
MREPEVLTGAREPRAYRKASKPEQSPGRRAALKEQAALSVPDKTVFQSDVAGLRIQLTANETEYLPGGRAAKKPKDLVLRFVDGICVLDSKKDEEAIGLAFAHANFKGNQGRDLFWLLKDAVEAKKAKANQEAADTLLHNSDALSDPEVRAKIVSALKASGEDFDLGGKAGKKAE